MSDSAAPLRVAVIGAQRLRQGTGPFLALQCAAAGGQLCGLLGRTAASASAASSWLARRKLCCPSYSNWQRLLEKARPEALLLATPTPTHRSWLERALEAGLHVLCEKPLLAAAPADGFAAAYAHAGLLLAENCQWPWTLPAFHALHPGFRFAGVRRFSMLLAPSGAPRERWMETLSHPLSLLQAAFPSVPGLVTEMRFPAPERLEFLYHVGPRRLACSIRLGDPGVFPRPAEYAFDLARCVRRILQPGYRFRFGDRQGRELAAPDPMQCSVTDFLRRATAAREGPVPFDSRLVRRQRLLGALLAAFPRSA